MYNLDVFEYVVDSPFGLYGSIPLLWAQRLGLTVAAFWCVPAGVPAHAGNTPMSGFKQATWA